MNRAYYILLLLIGISVYPISVDGQYPVRKLSSGAGEEYTRLRFSGQHYLFEASVGMIRLVPDPAEPGYACIELPGYYSSGVPGSPSLPCYSGLIEAGPVQVTGIRIDRLDSVIIDLGENGIQEAIAPFRPSTRKGESALPVRTDTAVYNLDGWTGGPVVEVIYEGCMRGLSISNLHFHPVQYNPRRGLLKVYHHVSCSIEVAGPPPSGNMPGQAFSGIFSRVVRQREPYQVKAIRAEQPMTLVILSDTLFRKELQPLIAWKRIKGFNVVEAYRQDSLVGSTRESIKAYLKSLYSNPPEGLAPPSFLLIVGDVEQVPHSQYPGQVTDLYYAEYDGAGDYIPDVFYGRISVKSPGQLRGVVDKILEYEQFRFADPSFLDEAVLIAGVDAYDAATFGNGQINYAYEYYLNPGNGNITHLFSYPESGSSAQAIRDLVSHGVGFVNYTGHGQYDRWENPAFRISDIDQLQNSGRYPVMIGNGCETDLFTADECFAEALIRAPEKGALAYIGCTNDSYWEEDYYWAVGMGPVTSQPGYEETSAGYYDRVFHTHDENYKIWTPSLGEMVFGGNMAVEQSTSSLKKFYWEIYQLAGDPSIVPWFSQPGEQVVSYTESIPAGSRYLNVSCAPHSYMALSRNGILLDALHASGSGYATLRIQDTLSDGKLDLVITGDRFEPWKGQVQIGKEIPVYLELLKYDLRGESVEPDRKLTPGEEASLNLEILNRGVEPVLNDTLVLFSGEGPVQLLDSILLIESLGPGDTLEFKYAFRFRVGPDPADLSWADLGISLKSAGTRLYVKEKLYAPVLESGLIRWDDRPFGNGNGMAESGEWLLCSWMLYNTGHFRTGIIHGALLLDDSSKSGEPVFLNTPVVEAGDSALLQFRILLDSAGKGWHNPGPFRAADVNGSVTDSIRIAINRYFEDFSPDWTRRFPFRNISASPWRTDQKSFSSGPFALRSGPISHNGQSEISLSFETDTDDTLSFAYRVSSEFGYDTLSFYVDSVFVRSWSGYTGWNHYSEPLEAGRHEITWSYRKDSNTSYGMDAAWIDDLSLPGSAFRSGDLSLKEITGPGSGAWLTGKEAIGIMVVNISEDTVAGVTARLDVNGHLMEEVHHPFSLNPGKEVEIMFGHDLDLSGFGSYAIEASIISDSTGYPGNNWLEKRVVHYVYPDLSLSLAGIEMVEGDYADAVIHLRNEGNIYLDSVMFETWTDNRIVQAGYRSVALDPGAEITTSFRLADSIGDPGPGFHLYHVRAILTDSVRYNNEVSGYLEWNATGQDQVNPDRGWIVFPNPVTSGLNLVMATPAGKGFLFQIYSMKGVLVGSYPIAEGTERLWIPAENISPGHYLLRLVNSGESVLLVVTR
jgi:hypothetical protein